MGARADPAAERGSGHAGRKGGRRRSLAAHEHQREEGGEGEGRECAAAAVSCSREVGWGASGRAGHGWGASGRGRRLVSGLGCGGGFRGEVKLGFLPWMTVGP